jgi:hypothetical protein
MALAVRLWEREGEKEGGGEGEGGVRVRTVQLGGCAPAAGGRLPDAVLPPGAWP